MSRLSIRLRVTLVFTAVMAVVLGGTGLFVYLRLGSQLDQTINRDLRSRASELAATIRVSDVGLGEAARTALRGGSESPAQVLTPSGRLFDPHGQRNGPPILDRAEVQAALGSRLVIDRSSIPRLGPEPVRLLATRFGFERHRLVMVVGDSLKERDDALRNLATLLLIGGPIALLLAALAAYGTVSAALRPVEAMRRRAAEISTAEEEQRLPLPRAEDELHRLGVTLNEMLDRIAAAIDRERTFVDNASHELRTPLGLHKTELELALRYGESPEELRAAIASAIEEADRLSQLAEGLLVMARADKGRLAVKLEPLDVAGVFASVRQRLGARAGEAGRLLIVDDADGLVIAGDRLRVEQALTNLVENALRHGDGPVRLWARADTDRIELHVSDAGPGFPQAFLPHAFERFSRADTGRAEGGAGLGLAIVEAIAHAHRGRAVARNAVGGGADVWIELDGG